MATSHNPQRRIALVTAGLGPGGAEGVIAQLARHWQGANHRVEIISFDRLEEPVFHDIPEGVAVHRLAVSGVVWRVIALRLMLFRRRPDIVISFLTKINLISVLACLGLGIRLVCSERNNPERQDAHPLWNLLLRVAYRRAGVIVCQTDAVRRCFSLALRDRLMTIPNPIPPADITRSPEGGARICAVGRLVHQKGFDLLLPAFAKVSARHPDWTLDIWGDGPDRAALETQIASLGLQGRACLRGLSPRPRSWIYHADLFVLSSRYEGFPNVLGEAMAACIPVLSTNCEFGPAEMIDHGHSGLLVSVDSAELASAMEALMNDPEMRVRLGLSGQKAMERFRPERVLRLWDALLEKALAPCSTSRAMPWAAG